MNPIKTTVVGITKYPVKNLRPKVGDEIVLEFEPENKHDNKAIEVFWPHKGECFFILKQLGYIKKADDLNDFNAQTWCHENKENLTAKVKKVVYKMTQDHKGRRYEITKDTHHQVQVGASDELVSVQIEISNGKTDIDMEDEDGVFCSICGGPSAHCLCGWPKSENIYKYTCAAEPTGADYMQAALTAKAKHAKQAFLVFPSTAQQGFSETKVNIEQWVSKANACLGLKDATQRVMEVFDLDGCPQLENTLTSALNDFLLAAKK